MTPRAARWGCALLVLLAPAACSSDTGSTPTPTTVTPSIPISPTSSGVAAVPRWDHVVIVIMSSRSYEDVIGNADAPFVNLLARSGATFTDAHAVARPAAPNYFALFAGSTFGVRSDACPSRQNGSNLATELVAHRLTFTSYAEGLPATGSRACSQHPYATAHNPPASFRNVPRSMLAKASAFGTEFTALPAVSFLIPDEDNSMSVSDVTAGDTWLREHITQYAAWATTHRSLLVITWDQANPSDADNHIPMLAIGTGVPLGTVTEHVDHYRLLATIEDGFGLPRLGATVGLQAIAALGG
jgi:phosphatidylinositol-3-phosphatase